MKKMIFLAVAVLFVISCKENPNNNSKGIEKSASMKVLEFMEKALSKLDDNNNDEIIGEINIFIDDILNDSKTTLRDKYIINGIVNGYNNYTSSSNGSTTTEATANQTSKYDKVSARDNESMASIIGTYVFTDELGDQWTLMLNEDKSGQLQKGDYIAYCSWKDYRKINKGIEIKFAANKPTIWFKAGVEEEMWVTHMVDGYFYASNSIAATKDPNWRLPITKIR